MFMKKEEVLKNIKKDLQKLKLMIDHPHLVNAKTLVIKTLLGSTLVINVFMPIYISSVIIIASENIKEDNLEKIKYSTLSDFDKSEKEAYWEITHDLLAIICSTLGIILSFKGGSRTFREFIMHINGKYVFVKLEDIKKLEGIYQELNGNYDILENNYVRKLENE